MTNKTIEQLAIEAEEVQSACNISGVANSMFHALKELRSHVNSNDDLAHHTITRAWVSKLVSLSGYKEDDRTFGNLFDLVGRGK